MPSSGVGNITDRYCSGTDIFQQRCRHADTSTAARATAGAHGQLRHRRTARRSDLADRVLGHTIAKTHVHGGKSFSGTVLICA
jgi:hypothetical protein